MKLFVKEHTVKDNIGGFHLYLSELAFINQFYSIMTRVRFMSSSSCSCSSSFPFQSSEFSSSYSYSLMNGFRL